MNQHIHIKGGVIALKIPVSGAEETTCFLCTAPLPETHKDGCDAYLGGFVHAVFAMMERGLDRPAFCVRHETQLLEMLVPKCQERAVYEKLKIPFTVLASGASGTVVEVLGPSDPSKVH